VPPAWFPAQAEQQYFSGTGQRLRPACDRLLDLRRPAEFRGPCGDYLLGIPAISLPSQGASNANANRDQETNERSQGRYLKGSAEFDARIGLYLSFNNVASGGYTGSGVWSANRNWRHMTRAISEIHIIAAPVDRRGGGVCRICSDIVLSVANRRSSTPRISQAYDRQHRWLTVRWLAFVSTRDAD
jgi:hypothetical protein